MTKSIKDMRSLALSGIRDRGTRKSYRNAIDHFCTWITESQGSCCNMETLTDEEKDLISDYKAYLVLSGVPVFCMDTYLYPVQKALQSSLEGTAGPTGGMSG